jgi:1,4-dihydroxy-2-naphthoate octaprenyltransferase
MKSIVAAFRPKTLTAALVPCLAATALASAHGQWSGKLLLWAILSAICIQIGTNLVNDAIDFQKGADTHERIGPQRITQAGILTGKQVLGLGSMFFLAAIGFGIPLVIQGGWPLVVIGLISVLMGYAYTAGPYPLAYVGLGDLFVIIFFGIVAVGGMFYLHTLEWSNDALVMGLQIGFLATTLIAINNFRDMEGDKRVGKKTMAVRFGAEFSRREIAFLSISPFLINFYWMARGYWIAGLLPLLVLPLAIKLVQKVKNTDPSPEYNKFLAQSAALHLLFGILLSVGFLTA